LTVENFSVFHGSCRLYKAAQFCSVMFLESCSVFRIFVDYGSWRFLENCSVFRKLF